MADNVSAPVEPERAEKPTDPETVTASEPTESAAATDKPAEAEAEKPASEEAQAEAKAEGDVAEAAPAPAEGEAAPAKDAPAEANGTPVSAKKSSKNRRSSTGLTQKQSLARRKSQNRVLHLDAKPGQHYMARLRSFAPWPAIICDDEILPESFEKTRPVTAMQKGGSYKGEYAEGGRRTHERTFPVMFLGSYDFAWVVNSALSEVPEEFPEKGKTKGLIEAWHIATEKHDLEYFKELLKDHQAAIDQEDAEIEAKEAEKEAAKAAKESKKGKRKSKAADTDVEMEDADDSKKAKPASKKRKKDAETDAEAEKPAKTPKSNTKLKLSTPKAPAEEKTPVSKRKAPAKRGKAAAPSDDDNSADAKESEKPVDPEELKKKKEKEILFLRHKLQKGFISRESPPAEDEMASMASYFDKLEKHTDLEVSIIRSTKINKVLKMIVKLNQIPKDETFNIRGRAMNILSSWKTVLDAADTPGPADKSDKPTANGSKEDEGTPRLETEEEKEAETKSAKDVDSPMPDVDAEKAPEPEKEAEAEKPVEESTEGTEKPAEPEATPAEEPAENAEAAT